jgi:16S rRNA processing protein RimM
VSGSTSTSSDAADDYLVVAQVLAPHGLRGALKCRVVTDFPERFKRGTRLALQRPHEAPRPVVLQTAQVSGDHALLRFAEIPDRTAAEAWREADVLVAADQAVPLPPGEFLWRDIIGLEVQDLAGRSLGTVAEILRTGANDVYVTHGPLGEVLVPATKEVIKDLDPARGRIVIDPLPGLIPAPYPADAPASAGTPAPARRSRRRRR